MGALPCSVRIVRGSGAASSSAWARRTFTAMFFCRRVGSLAVGRASRVSARAGARGIMTRRGTGTSIRGTKLARAQVAPSRGRTRRARRRPILRRGRCRPPPLLRSERLFQQTCRPLLRCARGCSGPARGFRHRWRVERSEPVAERDEVLVLSRIEEPFHVNGAFSGFRVREVGEFDDAC